MNRRDSSLFRLLISSACLVMLTLAAASAASAAESILTPLTAYRWDALPLGISPAAIPVAFLCGLLVAERLRLLLRVGQVESRAQRDGLTGLLHAGAFAESLRREVARANRYQRPVSLVLIDLDDFKLLNDRYGHPAGDRAIKFVASTLVGALRETDVVGRIGGDEFAVLLPETPEEEAERVADRLGSLLHARVPGPECEIAVSTGVASWVPGLTDQSLYCAADASLYREKRGRAPATGCEPGAVAEPVVAGIAQAA